MQLLAWPSREPARSTRFSAPHRMAGNGEHRFRYIGECAVWQSAKKYSTANRRFPGVDGIGQLRGWRDGKDDCSASIVVASTATQTYGQEGTILRYVFCTVSHSPHWLVFLSILWPMYSVHSAGREVNSISDG